MLCGKLKLTCSVISVLLELLQPILYLFFVTLVALTWFYSTSSSAEVNRKLQKDLTRCQVRFICPLYQFHNYNNSG